MSDLVRRDGAARRRAIRYWLEDPLVGLAQAMLSRVFRLLPTAWVSDFGALMSRVSPARYPESDARARRALRRLRPDLDDPVATERAVRRIWESTGRLIAELPILDRLWSEGRIDIVGREHLDAARRGGRPVIVAAVHLGNWEVIGVAAAKLGYEGAAMALVLENRFEHALITKLRTRMGGRVIPAQSSSRRAVVEALHASGLLLLHIDDFSRGVVQAPAFGRRLKPDGNAAYAVRLAKYAGAAIVPVYCERLGDAARFRVRALPEIPLDVTGDSRADFETNVAKLDAVFEPIVRAHLDQWFYVLDLEL